MQNPGVMFRTICVVASLLVAGSAAAFNMGDMMNPSKWMGGNKDRDRYDDDYYYEGPGYGGPGYGYGGPGYGYGGPGYGYGGGPGYGYGGPGYGGPGYGYGGGPGYGYGGAPAYGAGGAPAYGAGGGGSREAEIMQLKERLKQLEGGVQ